jgi:hypothetical protein
MVGSDGADESAGVSGSFATGDDATGIRAR